MAIRTIDLCACGKDVTTVTQDEAYCNNCYWRKLDKVSKDGANAVADALIQRCRDERDYPFLDISQWSWRTYNSWKARQE